MDTPEMPMQALPIARILGLALLLAPFSALAEGAPACRSIEYLRTQSQGDPAWLKLASRYYFPSCGDWLAEACLSPYKLDRAGSWADVLNRPDGSFESTAISTCPTGDASGIGPLEDLLRDGGAVTQRYPTVSQLRERMARQALHAWLESNQARNHDVAAYAGLLRAEGLPAALSGDDVQGALDQFQDRMTALEATAPGDQKRILHDYIARYVRTASEDILTPRGDGFPPDRTPGMKTRLAADPATGDPLDDRQRFELLYSRATADNVEDYQIFDGNLTSYHAKLLLFYDLDRKLHQKYANDPAHADTLLNQLASQLRYRLDFSGRDGTRWADIVPHNGFALGATARQIEAFQTPGGAAAGIDCMTFVQGILRQTGYPEPGRLSTSWALSSQRDPALSLERLDDRNAGSIRPGDTLIYKDGSPEGHGEVVVGYVGDPPQLVGVSARGDYVRGLVMRRLNLYPNAPRDCGQGTMVTTQPQTKLYRMSIEKEPP
jgi:hypothetical protein